MLRYKLIFVFMDGTTETLGHGYYKAASGKKLNFDRYDPKLYVSEKSAEQSGERFLEKKEYENLLNAIDYRVEKEMVY